MRGLGDMFTDHLIKKRDYDSGNRVLNYFFSILNAGSDISESQQKGGRSFCGLLHGWNNFLRGGAKRRFDIIMSLLILLPALPVMLLVMMAIWLSTFGREPVFYRQQRVGLNGASIDMIKFRSMRVDAEAGGVRTAALHDRRVTRIGRFIRKSRIDELPQLFNVLRGEMSLVGPRPERPEFVMRYDRQIEGYTLRHSVKPGITGWAQVSCGYGETLEDAVIKLFYDLNYIRKGCLRLDLAILLQTIPVVLTGRGAR
ncbi:MAG: exopolysaccharide biosynthesis polyprenyl glycosylphosphotransferase [Candidatus Thiodiazotropha sp. (ex Monitilora ramsayi)]|nr:exopolysaccharide biosynthesis polyprenyl glycosylphosphotransferase [Candidatus Thiodiazotropha sp. (ex Monitilora ramsayi)]